MYIHKLYRQEDHDKILAFLQQHDFATLVSYDGDRPVASHLLVEVLQRGESLLVNGHMSKANGLWRTFEDNSEVLLIFQGAHTYISPTWYNHLNVPTWNYQSVHVYGTPRVVTERDEVYAILGRLVDRYEKGERYRMATLPQDFVEREMKGIVAFQIEVTSIEASDKLSQNRNDEDYRNIVDHLEARNDDLSHQVARAMRENRQLPG